MSRAIDTVIDFPHERRSGIPIPVDILPHDALDIPIVDDGSTNAEGTPAAVALEVREALREEEAPIDLVINEGTISLPTAVRLAADFTAPYRLTNVAIEFNRATNPENPTLWHRVGALYAGWCIDRAAQPAACPIHESAPGLIVEPPVFDVPVVSFVTGQFQISVGIQVGDLREGVITPRPVDAICLAYSTAETEYGASVWGSNDAMGLVWEPIALSDLTSNVWKGGQLFIQDTHGTFGGESRTFYFAKTERFMFYKVVFATPIAQDMDVCAILALNLNGSLGASYDGQAYDYQVGERHDPVLAEGLHFLEAHIPEGQTFDDLPIGWPGGGDMITVHKSAKHPELDVIFALVEENASPDVGWLVRFDLDAGTGVISYSDRVQLTLGPGSSSIRGLCITKLPDNDYHVIVTYLSQVDIFSMVLGQEFTYGDATYLWMSGVASDETNIWVFAVVDVGVAASNHADILKFDASLVLLDTTVIFSNTVQTSATFEAMTYANGFLYLAQGGEPPFWRKYDPSTMTLVASRMIAPLDTKGNELSTKYFYGIGAIGQDYIVTGGAQYVVRMTTSFEQVDYSLLGDDPFGFLLKGLSVEPSGDFIQLSGTTNSVQDGVIRRRRSFFSQATVSTVVTWPLTDGATMLIKYFFRPWSFTGTEDGIRIARIFVFNDPRGVRVRRSHTLPSTGLTRVQLPIAYPMGEGEPLGIQVDYLHSVISYGTPRELSVFSRLESRLETFTLPVGGNTAQLIDSFNRPALYILNARGDGLGSAGNSSLQPGGGMVNEVPFGTLMTTTEQYQINYPLGILSTFDPMAGQEVTFLVADYGSFAIEFGGTRVTAGWHNFASPAHVLFNNAIALMNLRTNLSLIHTAMTTSKRVWFRIEVDRIATSPKVAALQAQGLPTTGDAGRGVRSIEIFGKTPEPVLKPLPLPVPQKAMILTYLDVYGGYVFDVLNNIPAMITPSAGISPLITQLLNMRGIDKLDTTLPGFVKAMDICITQIDATRHTDTCGIVDPLLIGNLDNMPVQLAYDRRHMDKAQIMLSFKINARRDRRAVSQYGRQMLIDTENRKG